VTAGVVPSRFGQPGGEGDGEGGVVGIADLAAALGRVVFAGAGTGENGARLGLHTAAVVGGAQAQLSVDVVGQAADVEKGHAYIVGIGDDEGKVRRRRHRRCQGPSALAKRNINLDCRARCHPDLHFGPGVNYLTGKTMARVTTTKLSSKGQVVIPEEIRRRLRLEPGERFVVAGEGDAVVLKRIQEPPMREFRGLIEQVEALAGEPASSTPETSRIEAALDEAVRRIVETVDPLRIMLFGSVARGDARPDSDADLLVVVPAGTHRRQTAQRILGRMQGIGIPIEVVVATPDDLERYRDDPGMLYGSMLREGREIYVA